MNRSVKELNRSRKEYLNLGSQMRVLLKNYNSDNANLFKKLNEQQNMLIKKMLSLQDIIPNQIEKAEADFIRNGINAKKRNIDLLRKEANISGLSSKRHSEAYLRAFKEWLFLGDRTDPNQIKILMKGG